MKDEHCSRGEGGITLNQAQIDELSTLLDAQQSAFNNNNFTVGLGGPLYEKLAEFITGPNGKALPDVDEAVWTWIDGARDVNAQEGFFAAFIADYTATQYELRQRGDPNPEGLSGEQLNKRSSNLIAFKVIDDIVSVRPETS